MFSFYSVGRSIKFVLTTFHSTLSKPEHIRKYFIQLLPLIILFEFITESYFYQEIRLFHLSV